MHGDAEGPNVPRDAIRWLPLPGAVGTDGTFCLHLCDVLEERPKAVSLP
jgi:hypothetical protein